MNIKVGEFYFPVDFIVLGTQAVSCTKGQIPIILSRPFLSTSNAIIDYRNGSMQMSFGYMTAECTHEVCAIGYLIEEVLEEYKSDEELWVLFKNMSSEHMQPGILHYTPINLYQLCYSQLLLMTDNYISDSVILIRYMLV